jgi:hypothetical protein
VLQRIDARQVDTLVVVGVAADQASEEESLCRDERQQRAGLPEVS